MRHRHYACTINIDTIHHPHVHTRCPPHSYFPIYELLRDRLKQRGLFGHEMGPSAAPAVAGVVARTIAATLISPLEYLRTNLQSRSAGLAKEDGLMHMARQVVSRSTPNHPLSRTKIVPGCIANGQWIRYRSR